jgi:hypothetical protein
MSSRSCATSTEGARPAPRDADQAAARSATRSSSNTRRPSITRTVEAQVEVRKLGEERLFPGRSPDRREHHHAEPVDQAEFFATFYGPTSRALATLGADRGADLKADMVEVARRFDVSDDDTLVLRQDYLEAVIHKPATP